MPWPSAICSIRPWRVIDYLPYPGENGGISLVDEDGNIIGEQKVTDDAPARALAFKVINDQFGSLTFIRIYSGVIKKGDTLANVTRSKKERVGRIVEVQANMTKDIEEARAGDICALVSMSETETGDSLCDPAHPALLERMRFPDPVISVAIEPKIARRLRQDVGGALQDGEGGPVAAARTSTTKPARPCCAAWASCTSKSRSTACAPSSASKPTMGKPRVSFREAFGSTVEHIYTHKKQTGGSGQFAEVKMIVRARARPGTGIEFIDEVVGGRIPREFIPSVEHAIRTESQERPDRRLRSGGLQGASARRQVPRRGQLGARVRNRRPRVLPRSAQG